MFIEAAAQPTEVRTDPILDAVESFDNKATQGFAEGKEL